MASATTTTYQHQEIKRTVYERQPVRSPLWLRALSWLALVGWWGFATYWYVCKIKHHCEELSAATAITPPDNTAPAALPAASFVVSDGSRNVVDVADVFKARQQQAQVAVSPRLQSGAITQLVTYLQQNADRELRIVGGYAADEANPTKFENLGIARAEDVKQRLLALGIDGKRISTAAELRANYAPVADTMLNCIAMNLAVTKAIEKDITIEPRIIYFKTAKSEIAMTPELQKYFADVKTYLQQKPTATVSLTGHTDNVGSTALNQQLGLQRAQNTQHELAKIGIDAQRVLLNSKGEVQPIETNDTETGRQANRRCEIIIK